MKGIFYAVGVGPGDPELMTIKAVKTIEKCSVIAVPASGAASNAALAIAGEHAEAQRNQDHNDAETVQAR